MRHVILQVKYTLFDRLYDIFNMLCNYVKIQRETVKYRLIFRIDFFNMCGDGDLKKQYVCVEVIHYLLQCYSEGDRRL